MTSEDFLTEYLQKKLIKPEKIGFVPDREDNKESRERS